MSCNSEIWENFALDDLWWPQFWPHIKMTLVLSLELVKTYRVLFFRLSIRFVVYELAGGGGGAVRGALLGEGRHCLKGRPCQNARYWRCNTALGLRDAEDRLPIGRHVKYDSIENELLYRFHLNAGRFFRVQFIWYCGHGETNENTNLYIII